MIAKPLSKVLYTAEATVQGGRAGHGRTADGRLDVELSVPDTSSPSRWATTFSAEWKQAA